MNQISPLAPNPVTVPGSLVTTYQPVALTSEDDPSWLYDPVRQTSAQVSAEGCDQARPSSRDVFRVLQPQLHRPQER